MVIDRIANLLFPDVRKYISWEELYERVVSLHEANERLNKIKTAYELYRQTATHIYAWRDFCDTLSTVLSVPHLSEPK